MGNEARAGRLRQSPAGAVQGDRTLVETFDPLAFERRLEVARIRRAISLEARVSGLRREDEGALGDESASGAVPQVRARAEDRIPPHVRGSGVRRRRVAVIGRIFGAGLALGLGLAAVLTLPETGARRLPDAPPPKATTMAPSLPDPPPLAVAAAPRPAVLPQASPFRPVRLAAPMAPVAPANLAAGWRVDSGVVGGNHAAVHVRLSVPPSLSEAEIAVAAARLRDAGFGDVVTARSAVSISRTNVRFFSGADAIAASAAAAALAGDWPGAEARDFTHLAARPEPGSLEIWLAGRAPARGGGALAVAAAGEAPPPAAGLAGLLGRVFGGSAGPGSRRDGGDGVAAVRASRSFRPAAVMAAPRTAGTRSGAPRGSIVAVESVTAAAGGARVNGNREAGGSKSGAATGSGGATSTANTSGESTGSGRAAEAGGTETGSGPATGGGSDVGANTSNQGPAVANGQVSRSGGISGHDSKARGNRAGDAGRGWGKGGRVAASTSGGRAGSKSTGKAASKGGGKDRSKGGGNDRSKGGGNPGGKSGPGGKGGRNR